MEMIYDGDSLMGVRTAHHYNHDQVKDWQRNDQPNPSSTVRRWRSNYGIHANADRGPFLTDPLLCDFVEGENPERRREPVF